MHAAKASTRTPEGLTRPQVKICGLTDADSAACCADLGVNAIGCVFYSKSPRFVSDKQAKDICDALPVTVQKVGVFVDSAFAEIMHKVDHCGLTAVQLHGHEPPALVSRLRRMKLGIIKALFTNRPPRLSRAAEFQNAAFLVEAGKGKLPGGNAVQWDWGATHRFAQQFPLILAGGLTPDNVIEAVTASGPDAVDISSGVESVPGRKDAAKVRAFLNALRSCRITHRPLRKIF